MKFNAFTKWLATLLAALSGCGWLWCLFVLSKGQGLVNMDPWIGCLDLIVVGVLTLIIFAINLDFGLIVLAGWVAGQFALLVWDGTPRGRSPQMFAPVNFEEAGLYAVVFVAVLNLSVLPARGLDWLVA